MERCFVEEGRSVLGAGFPVVFCARETGDFPDGLFRVLLRFGLCERRSAARSEPRERAATDRDAFVVVGGIVLLFSSCVPG